MIVFDKHIDADAFAKMLAGWVGIPAHLNTPKLAYVGDHHDDEDYHHVLQLAWENDALLISSDTAMPGKAGEFGRCGDHNHHLRGVVVLPTTKAIQVELFSALIDGRMEITNLKSQSAIDMIRNANLGLDLTAKQPAAVELCRCPWTYDEELRKRRFKRK